SASGSRTSSRSRRRGRSGSTGPRATSRPLPDAVAALTVSLRKRRRHPGTSQETPLPRPILTVGMEQCLVCGAALKPGVECGGQCYAPMTPSHPAYHGPGAAGSGDQDDVRFRPPPSPIEVRYSRFRGGPTSMGAVGRLLTSVLAILLAAAVYMYLFPVMLGHSGGSHL